MYAVEVREGRAEPLPDYVSIVDDARYWGVSPMEIREWPRFWVEAGRIKQEAESIAHARRQGKK